MSSKAKRAKCSTHKQRVIVMLYNKVCDIVASLSELLEIQLLTDTTILQVKCNRHKCTPSQRDFHQLLYSYNMLMFFLYVPSVVTILGALLLYQGCHFDNFNSFQHGFNRMLKVFWEHEQVAKQKALRREGGGCGGLQIIYLNGHLHIPLAY